MHKQLGTHVVQRLPIHQDLLVVACVVACGLQTRHLSWTLTARGKHKMVLTSTICLTVSARRVTACCSPGCKTPEGLSDACQRLPQPAQSSTSPSCPSQLRLRAQGCTRTASALGQACLLASKKRGKASHLAMKPPPAYWVAPPPPKPPSPPQLVISQELYPQPM